MSIRSKIGKVKGALLGLAEGDASPDPLVLFEQWFKAARDAKLELPESMILATASPDGVPSARAVLLKGVDERGFRFFTNFESDKAKVLAQNPKVALVFHWAELVRQVRIEGCAEKISPEESEVYFQSRPRGSRIGAWASAQSSVLGSREELEVSTKAFTQKFAGAEVPRPPFWGGYVVCPERIEFWQGRADRLHDRLCYIREGKAWRIVRLAP